ncbi:pullulanase-type alpha-1,6-glucosidase [Pseudobacteriovorax antillogorgiicola]|uniref:Alpha-1,6-glucosidases, pullulanase-type n=1 Tax=Pseudobacteriovorax antillogorgiicola TaxID=1513793 RepID=A0A1Y6BJH9_9BACT|nr:pullulanase-type alpha-1,6-glucosidase [Pseudobacteriovorax antillogorgiicola]TCS55405.1 pullulanase-type alpha-1,6-glucosidase [Pseudobacteriovorax antillogorgiicola]SMF12893.1 alpha-1,6-glucosidases, pullulanase-type [Pseudobacteriovorax antillogorgiicola]
MNRTKCLYFLVILPIFLLFSACETKKSYRVTLHFHNHFPADQWQVSSINGSVESTGSDDFGYIFKLKASNKKDLTIEVRNQNGKTLQYILPSNQREFWTYEASNTVFELAPPVIPSKNQMVVFYNDPDGDYTDWGLHLWDQNTGTNWTNWQEPFTQNSTAPELGLQFTLDLPPNDGYSAAPPAYEAFPTKMGLVVHRGAEKSTENDLVVYPQLQGRLYFIKKGQPVVACSPDFQPCPNPPTITDAAAHWTDRETIRWNLPVNVGSSFELRYSPSSNITVDFSSLEVKGGEAIALEPMSLSADSKFPHLNDFRTFKLSAITDESLKQIVKSQLVAVALDSKQRVLSATQVQMPGLLDQEFSSQKTLGLSIDKGSPVLRLWAPTAQTVELMLYNQDKSLLGTQVMTEAADGVWSATGNTQWLVDRPFYRYRIQTYHYFSDQIETYEVIDPYSLSLSTNSKYSQIVDLNAADLKPQGWDKIKKPGIHPSDISVYEVHIRDFSIADLSVAPEQRGLYTAFDATAPLSDGMSHLKGLADAGLSHVQVLPAADFATVNEKRSEQVNLDDPIDKVCGPENPPKLCVDNAGKTFREVFAAASKSNGDIQELNALLRNRDGFNWGYDPMVFGAPEGSYSSDPDGPQRILEFRRMVKGLWDLGLRFSLDVVYNHTNASKLFENSVLDKTVPGYYHRRDPISGKVANSSCCENTATEHIMMEKLMIDTLEQWADQYKVDAFRFDLMGHHMKSNLVKAREILGDQVYLYGEGWNFGEVANNQRGTNATQLNMFETGIGSFNDRMRDAIRGGGAFDCGYLLVQQGLGNGLLVDTNEWGGLQESTGLGTDCSIADHWQGAPQEQQVIGYQDLADRLRVGLAGSIRSFPIVDRYGQEKRADEVSYFGVPTAYTADPFETINYISKHDNQTLWDINQLKLPLGASSEERVAAQKIGFSFNLLAQGIPFFQLGSDLLRSKSLNRDSFDSGDWFNKVDYTGATTVWNKGLPRADKDGQNWELFRKVLDDVPEGPSQEQVLEMAAYVRKLLALRYESPLFRLRTGEDVNQRVRFSNTGPQQTPGLIAMSILDSCALADLDSNVEEFLILFNVGSEGQDVAMPSGGFSLHSFNPDLSFTNQRVTVPGRSIAVMVKKQQSDCR